MISKSTGNLLVAFCAIVLAAAYLVATFSIRDIDIVDPLGPKAFPFLLGIGMLVCGVSLAITTLIESSLTKSDGDTPQEAGSHPLAVMMVGVWMLAYYLVFETFGFLLSTVIFLMCLTMYFNRGHWMLNVAVSVLFPICLELVFSHVLGRAPAPGLFSF